MELSVNLEIGNVHRMLTRREEERCIVDCEHLGLDNGTTAVAQPSAAEHAEYLLFPYTLIKYTVRCTITWKDSN